MEALEDNQIAEWAERFGLVTGEHFTVELPDLPEAYQATYACGQRSGQERDAANELVQRLGSWDECLVWVRLWGVWASGEDWPKFYAWRGRHGERRSLYVAPAHRFEPHERDLLVELVTLVMENAWDADVLCVSDERADRILGRISHDEWFAIHGAR